jgi:serine/threonine protein phosphatase PrpC
VNIPLPWRQRRGGSAPHGPAPRFDTASRSHPGTRQLNEDRLLELPDLGLWAVADGMGGHRRGDLAAETVVAAIAAAQPRDAAQVRAAVDLANTRLHSESAHDAISGSTLVVLHLEDARFECFWAGDSELWLARAARVQKVTRDHSVVEELVRSGLIDESDRHAHPQGHLVTRAIGAAQSVELDMAEGSVEDGDVFLLCSDGLTGAISPDDLTVLTNDRPLEAIADDLLARALAQNASDNVTFILVRATVQR